ncbi:hypothetical protein [Lewinella sp. 4G2]|uniref:hypothetical protein n=1 Tax=Lewinella sp. 4G2 TaxID=1803372 RepID=UPI0007B4950D|nr:hypothetical protein [Lewinella sp. 4G2]OAV43534.1 hypothetical protein A3850_003055 [Lewinella sp. 4G2]
MSFWDSITELFRSAEESTPGNAAVHELIVRDEEYLEGYEQWKRTHNSRRLLDWLEEQYATHKAGAPTDQGVGFLNLSSSKGFVIYFKELNYQPEEIAYFFDFLKERVLTLNYRSDISDRRIFSRRDWVETQERHYLKPINTFEEGELLHQAFGNITIQHELRDGVPHNLRLRATFYSDALYEEAHSFGALMIALAHRSPG